MKNLKVILGTILIMCIFSLVAYAQIPEQNERLASVHEELIVDRQMSWDELDNKQDELELEIEKILSQKKKLESEANVFRETIAVLRGEDFPQPLK